MKKTTLFLNLITHARSFALTSILGLRKAIHIQLITKLLNLVYNPYKMLVLLVIWQFILRIFIFPEIIYAAEPNDGDDEQENTDSMAYTLWTKVYHVITLGGHKPEDNTDKLPNENQNNGNRDEDEDEYEPSPNLTINLLMDFWDWCTGNGPYKYINENQNGDLENDLQDEVHEVPVADLPVPVAPMPFENISLKDIITDPELPTLSQPTLTLIEDYFAYKETLNDKTPMTDISDRPYADWFTRAAKHLEKLQLAEINAIYMDLLIIVSTTDNPDAKALALVHVHVTAVLDAGEAAYMDAFGNIDRVKLETSYIGNFISAQANHEADVRDFRKNLQDQLAKKTE